MSTLDQIALRIIKEQELIIGPIAWSEAKKVSGLTVKGTAGSFDIEENISSPSVIDGLVGQYEHLFGRASREASKDVVQDLLSTLSPSEIPTSLK